jgi:hypothetical protein
VQCGQGAQDLGNVPAAELGEGLHAELGLNVLLVVKQEATGRLAVTADPAGFLDVVFQGVRNVSVDDQAYSELKG